MAESGEDNVLKRKHEVDHDVLDKMEFMPALSDGMFYEYESSSSYESHPMENKPHWCLLGGDVELSQGLGLSQEVEGEKEKKYAKKGNVYPTVGHPARERKAAPP